MAKDNLTLFTGVQGFEEAEKLAKKLKPPRVRFKNTTYTKIYKNDVIENENTKLSTKDDLATWGQMKEVYIELANCYLHLIPFGSPDTVFVFGNVRVWKQVYTNKSYIYRGERYKEVPDVFYEAEIIGTENLQIEQRLKIHKKLLEQVKQNCL